MSGSGGYEVQRGGMGDQAGRLDRAGDDTGGIGEILARQPCRTADALGGSDSGPAYDRFAAAWQAEARLLEEALHELAGRVRLSARAYGTAEHEAGNGIRRAATTTVPAEPAGPHSVFG
ncbi:WXG100 family type VII secretion target [Streptomyces sp. NPDC088354]|uniref:WXG100 family type VII secretion target n=1 Tax=Streptomyces sp. NPDC088354 TaxID=3365856 RepID=UPI003811E554